MAQGQEVGGGCANRIWGQWQPWVVVTKIGVCMHKMLKNVNKIDEINCCLEYPWLGSMRLSKRMMWVLKMVQACSAGLSAHLMLMLQQECVRWPTNSRGGKSPTWPFQVGT